MMRRLFSLLLMYSVLLTQGVAPISVSLAAARSLDPVANAILCSESAGNTQGSTDHQGASSEHCAQCTVALGSFALLPPENNGLWAAPDLARVDTWPLVAYRADARSYYHIAQARAPPLVIS